ncbi:MAG: SpoIIE family protein phosphatase [Blautia sp.]|nr:SpoIIE family protein phosphatase [Blautia sp.]
MKKTRRLKKNRKLLFQVGSAIILFSFLIAFAISRLVTISAFSTSLAGIAFTNGGHIDEYIDALSNIEVVPWLLNYWGDNRDTLEYVYSTEEMQDLETYFHEKYDAEDLTLLPLDTLSSMDAEDKEQYAYLWYLYLKYDMELYANEYSMNELLMIIPEPGTRDAYVLIDSRIRDGDVCDLSATISLEELESIWNRFDSLLSGGMVNLVKSFPSPDSRLGFSQPLILKDVDTNVLICNTFNVKDVYDTMEFVTYVRRNIISLLLIGVVFILLLLYCIVLRPLSQMEKCMNEYEKDKDTGKVVERLSQIRSRNEIGVFADNFSQLAREMEHYTDEAARLAGESEKVATELNVAAKIQLDMLPAVFPDRKDFSLYAVMDPAREVGGDFYDFYMRDPDHLVMTIADVSGKGVPAALFMAVSKAILKNRTLLGGTPADILADANNQLCEGNDADLFVTVWLGILTISTGELISANAGHEYPVMRTGSEPFHLIKSRHGMALGAMEGLRYRNETCTISPGDFIFVYTDGVPEATAQDESMFGTERLENILRSIPDEESPGTVLKTVHKAVYDFVGEAPQFDDLTMLGLNYHGPDTE